MASEPGNLVDSPYKAISALLELLAHVGHRVLLTTHGFNAGNLSKSGCAGIRIGHKPAKLQRQITAHHAVSKTPSGHGVGLGKPIQHDGAVFPAVDGHEGEVAAFKNQAAVNLVGEHHDVAVTDGSGQVENVF